MSLRHQQRLQSLVRLLQQSSQPTSHTNGTSDIQLCLQCYAAAAASSNSILQGFRGYADTPAPSDPVIIPLRQQQQQPPAVQQPSMAALVDRNKGPWEKVQDKATGGTYWWNPSTDVTTPVGAPKPDAWVEAMDKQSGLTYYWNQDSGDTTAVGEPRPGPEGRLVAQQQQQQFTGQRTSLGKALGNSLAVGFGIGLMFGVLRIFMG